MKTIIIYSDELKNYDFGEGHPFRSDRFKKFLELFKEKLGKDKRFELTENITLATDEELKLWHSKDYIKIMKDASQGKAVSNLFRFISGDNVNPSTKKLPQGIEEGFTVNLPLESGTGDKAYELIFDEIIFPLAREYKPQMIIRYGGSDPYFDDGLTSLGLTFDGFEMIGKKVREVSSELCNNRSVDLLCSGYNLEVLPKVWLTLVAAISGVKINFKESAPDIKNRRITETRNLIKKVKEKLAPYWESIKRETREVY